MDDKRKYLSRVAVVGGGRWSRVILSVLDELLPAGISVSVHSESGESSLRSWLSKSKLRRHVLVSSEYPCLSPLRDCAVIVVNAAHDHVAAAKSSLSAGAPTLVEKPVALTENEVSELRLLSEFTGARFAAANVFSFNRYIGNYHDIIMSHGGFKSLSICWTDQGESEQRYGEIKRFDSSLPIYVDWLPHVLSILRTLGLADEPRLKEVCIDRGGAHMVIECAINGIGCKIVMSRKSNKRIRLIEAACADGYDCILDFSKEPGVISDGLSTCTADPLWNVAPGPLASMLDAFLLWSVGGPGDTRFDISLSQRVAAFIDRVRSIYEPKQDRWISDKVGQERVRLDSDLYYALSERIQVNGRLPDTILWNKIQTFIGQRAE